MSQKCCLSILVFGNLCFSALLIASLVGQFILFPKGFPFIWSFQLVVAFLLGIANWKFYRKYIRFKEVLNDLKK